LWIDEGIAQFAQTLVRERSGGRQGMLDFMNSRTAVLAQVEDSLLQTDDEIRGDALVVSHNDVLIRLKAMFVFTMLRDMLGDAALQRALAAYRPLDDKEPSYLQRLLERESKKDLEWFFDDWVYRDRGLPEFKVADVVVRPTLQNTSTVVVTVENSGAAAAEVPIVVTAAAGEKNTERTERLRVPAGGKATARITVPAQPVMVTVNDGSVPEKDRTDNSARIEPRK
jgi:aminopeptidase N